MRAEMFWCVLGAVVMWTLFVLPADGLDQCEWKRVFKAVRASGRNVRADFLSGGAINEGVPDALKISTEMPYRDSTILDKWYKLDIEKVKVEVFKEGVRESWFVFNGLTSTIQNWFSKDRLNASPYEDIRTIPDSGTGVFWSIDGATPGNKRHFYINRNYGGCPNDCGYLVVVDGNSACAWGSMNNKPYFLYGKKKDTCSKTQTAGETGVGDRFVISVRVCYP